MTKGEYIKILKEELVPAMGCTEPIAIAYAAARLREELGEMPDELKIECSGNIIKNVKSAVIPNTDGLTGVEVAAIAGLVSGNSSKQLEVLNDLDDSARIEINDFLKKTQIKVEHLNTIASLHVIISGKNSKNTAKVELIHSHTNIVKVEKNGKIIFEKDFNPCVNDSSTCGRENMSVKGIIDFANSVNLSEVKSILEPQIRFNLEISKYGLTHSSNLGISQGILDAYQHQGCKGAVEVQIKAELAAAVEARLSGSPHTVVTNSGSGSQGLCVSIPVLVYAREAKIDKDKTMRALLVSNLLAIHQKTSIGRLSAFCGATTATASAVAGITYLKGGTYQQIADTLTNTLATISGMICDGAKVSCAAKAVVGLDAGFLAHHLAMNNHAVKSGDGIIKDNIEKTIASVGEVAAKGMRKTDEVILDVMLK